MINLPAFRGAKQLIDNNATKIYIYFGTAVYGPDYDPNSNNVTYTLLPPKVINGYTKQISSSALVWKEYGLQEMGSIEILCDSKYTDWFKNCVSVVVNNKKYRAYKFGQGKLAIIEDRGHGLIRVALQIVGGQ